MDVNLPRLYDVNLPYGGYLELTVSLLPIYDVTLGWF